METFFLTKLQVCKYWKKSLLAILNLSRNWSKEAKVPSINKSFMQFIPLSFHGWNDISESDGMNLCIIRACIEISCQWKCFLIWCHIIIEWETIRFLIFGVGSLRRSKSLPEVMSGDYYYFSSRPNQPPACYTRKTENVYCKTNSKVEN